ncbi:MAG: ASPIC/UnbV domain-containing protein [Verrucomicrobiaceae bacterium]
MSHAPVEASDYQGEELAYAKATEELNSLVDAGTPWSGSERNQVFLNLGKQLGNDKSTEFADISAVAGFDFPDDSRGLTSLDWDLDGDLDFLTTNRTAPRVRLFENQFPLRDRSSLSVKLIGTKVNRDAIGSRVELTITNDKKEKTLLHRTLTAGHGFLSQASKWIHFGIPENTRIETLTVFWDGQTKENFPDLKAGGFFQLKQGTQKPSPWNPPFKPAIPSSSEYELEPLSPTSMAHLERPLPLPDLPVIDQSGKETNLSFPLDKPILLNLWATWCPDCAGELTDFAAHRSDFEKTGVELVTLCVDIQLGDAEGRAKALKILSEKGVTSRPLFVTGKTLDLIHLCHAVPFIRPEQLPAPSSLLITADGHLRTVFRGAADQHELILALQAATLENEQWQAFARPAEGPWVYGPDVIAYSGVAKSMIEQDWLQEAGSYLLERKDSLKDDGKLYPELLMLTGTRFLEQNLRNHGICMLEAAVEAAPELAAARNNLAVALLQMNRGAEAVPHLEAAINADPDFLNPRMNLAQYHTNTGNHDIALNLITPVLQKQYHPKAIRIRAQIEVARQDFRTLLKTFQLISQNEPQDPGAWINLGKLYQQFGNTREALHSFESASTLLPQNKQLIAAIAQLREKLKNSK